MRKLLYRWARALDFSYDLDFWGRNREVLQSARANVARQRRSRCCPTRAHRCSGRAYFNLDLQFALLDVAKAAWSSRTPFST